MHHPQPEDKCKPVIKGRASILTSSIKIEFKWNKQCNKLIKLLVDEGYSFRFYQKDLESNFIIEIEEVPWATNLKFLAKKMEECDYQEI